MRKTQPPAALYDAAVYYAHQHHASRLQEVKAMRAALDLLEPYMPDLRAQHVAPAVPFIHWRATSRALSFSTVLTSDSVKLHQALLGLGFTETARQDHGSFVLVDLKKGRLKVHVTVYPSKAAA